MGNEGGGGVRSQDSVNGGTDVWSCAQDSSPSSADHLVVMVHGILGRYNLFIFPLNLDDF